MRRSACGAGAKWAIWCSKRESDCVRRHRGKRRVKKKQNNYAKAILFLTMQCMKAYHNLGVNFLPMSASRELEPGPSRLQPEVGLRVQPRLSGRTTSREMGLSAQADGRGGFTAG